MDRSRSSMNNHNCNVHISKVCTNHMKFLPWFLYKIFYVCPFGNKRRLDFEVWQDHELQDVIADRWPTSSSSSSPPSPSSSSSARSETRNIETWSFLIEQNDWWCISTPYHNSFVGRYNSFTHFKWRSWFFFPSMVKWNQTAKLNRCLFCRVFLGM